MGRETKTHTNADGSTVQVGVNAVVSPRAHIGPGAVIWGGTILGGDIRGGTILGGEIFGGTVWGGTILGGDIRGGTILGGEIYGGEVLGGTINGGTINGGTVWGGVIRGGKIRGGEIEAGTIRGGLVESTEDVVVGGPVGNEPTLLTAVPNEDRSGWLIVGGCSRAVPFDLGSDDDPFVTDFPPETEKAAAERALALQFIRALCQARQANWSNNGN